MQYRSNPRAARALLSSVLFILVCTNCASPQAQINSPSKPTAPTQTQATAQPAQATSQTPARPQTPSETVRAFYTALRERRVRDAFALSIYKSAVEALTPEEFEELRPEFEKLGDAVPAQIGIYGEQISGERATVFAVISTDPGAKQEAIEVLRAGDGWIVGSREDYDTVQREGKEFFFKTRIETHHAELRKVLLKLANVEAIYAAQNAGRFANLASLASGESAMRLGLKDDLDALSTLGYHLALAVSSDGKGYKVNAEPTRYGRTGRISFYMDAAGIQEKDNGGKPYNPPTKKK
jgi:hypothetical protein